MNVKTLIEVLQALPPHCQEFQIMYPVTDDFGTGYEPVQTVELSGGWVIVG